MLSNQIVQDSLSRLRHRLAPPESLKTVGFKDTEDYFCLHPPPPPPRITIFLVHARAGVCEVSGQVRVFKPDLTSPPCCSEVHTHFVLFSPALFPLPI